MKIYILENQNYVDNIEKTINNIDIDDNNSDEYKESMMKMRYEAFQVSDTRFMILFQCK